MIDENSSSEDCFVFYRILGNDLPPLHSPQQTIHNLRFILDYEPQWPNVEKRWIVNRITDPEIESQVIELLRSRSQHFIHVAFDLEEYRKLQPDYSHFTEQDFADFINSVSTKEHIKLVDYTLHDKNQYVMNLNKARNLALRDGRSRARWILPWDGNCFLTEASWGMISALAREDHAIKYIIVPMERLFNNENILDPGYYPTALEEPQIIFRNDSLEEFDEQLRYGRLPKVELLRRLGVPGLWDHWDYQPWENRQWTASPELGQWKSAGWVARLFSGEQVFDNNPSIDEFRKRSRIRRMAIRHFLQRLDEQVLRHSLKTDALLVYDEDLLQLTKDAWRAKRRSSLSHLADSVIAQADRALSTPPGSVVHKASIPPSGDLHDYLSSAPFWWPNPETPDGLPYVRRDGKRTPESELFSKDSEKYDYSRLQTMFESVTVLALAWHFTESICYARHAIEIIRTWFLKPATRMNPHMRYAQVHPGHDYTGRGIIEAKDFYYFLDGVRLLQRSPVCLPPDEVGFASWCQEYLFWLLTSEQGVSEAHKSNNHGTCYDLQAMALCAFVGDYGGFVKLFDRSKARLSNQVCPDGSQAQELSRADALHYCTFNLQSWFNIAFLADRAGGDLWNYPARDRSVLEKAFRWMFDEERWRSLQGLGFDESRLAPLITAGMQRLDFQPDSFFCENAVEPRLCLHPYAGVPPYWPLVFGLSCIEDNVGLRDDWPFVYS